MASTRSPTKKRLGRAARVAWVAGLLFGTFVLVSGFLTFESRIGSFAWMWAGVVLVIIGLNAYRLRGRW